MKYWKWYKIMVAVGFILLLAFMSYVYIVQDASKQEMPTHQQAPVKRSPFVTN